MKEGKIIVKLSQLEADMLIKNKLNFNLMIASVNKKHGGKTYYVKNNDRKALKAIADFRHCTIESLVGRTFIKFI